MTCKVQQTLDRYAMLEGAKSVCAGVSGGMDSMCLLDLLVQLQPQYGFSLQVVHVNHLLRGENADRDALFVQQRCRDYGVPCTWRRSAAKKGSGSRKPAGWRAMTRFAQPAASESLWRIR